MLDAWLEDRVASLGFESGEDLPLLTAADFDPGLLSAEELARVDETFPAALDLGSGRLTATCDATSRMVTLQGRQPPRIEFLRARRARWPGWSVRFTDGKRSVVLRS